MRTRLASIQDLISGPYDHSQAFLNTNAATAAMTDHTSKDISGEHPTP
jgi:hypothetical protein